MKITDRLFVAAFSDLVTTFQPKTWPKYIRNLFCQIKITLNIVGFIGLFASQMVHLHLALINIFDLRQVLFYSKNS